MLRLFSRASHSHHSIRMSTMRAVVIRAPGGPEVLKMETLPIPRPKEGEVLIKVMAAGVNRSEMFSKTLPSLSEGLC